VKNISRSVPLFEIVDNHSIVAFIKEVTHFYKQCNVRYLNFLLAL